MDRRAYRTPKMIRQNEKWEKLEQAYKKKLDEKAMLEKLNQQNEYERASLQLAIEVEKDMKFGSRVKIIRTCPGCVSCENQSDCYVVEVPKNLQNKIPLM